MKRINKFILALLFVFSVVQLHANSNTIECPIVALANDLSTSGTEFKTLIKSPDIFKAWNILNKEFPNLRTNIEELKLVSKNLDEITKVGYTAWKKVSKAGSLSEDIINQVNDALGTFYSKSNDTKLSKRLML